MKSQQDILKILESLHSELLLRKAPPEEFAKIHKATKRLAAVAELRLHQAEKESSSAEEAQTHLRRMLDGHRETLTYMEVDIASLESLRLDVVDVSRFLVIIKDLDEALDHYERTLNLSPKSASERRAREEELAQLEQRVHELLDNLWEFLDGTQGDREEEQEGEDEQGEHEEEDEVPASETRVQSPTASDIVPDAEADQKEPTETESTPDHTPEFPGEETVEGPTPVMHDAETTPKADDPELVEQPTLENEPPADEEIVPSSVVTGPAVELLWRWFESGHFAGAYWAAREIERDHGASPIPSWLLLACLGSVTVGDSLDQAREVLLNVYQEHPDPVGDVRSAMNNLDPFDASLLVTTAALRATLVAPDSGAFGWLQRAKAQAPDNALRELLAPVEAFSQTGQPLTPGLLHSTVSRAELAGLAARASQKIQGQVRQINMGRTSYAPATRILRHFVSEQSEVGRAIAAVASNDSGKVDLVQGVLEGHLSSRRSIEGLVDHYGQELAHGRKYRPVEGQALDKILREVDQVRNSMREWLQAVSSLERRRSADDWLMTQAQVLVRDFENNYRKLAPLLQNSTNAHTVAIRKAALLAIDQVRFELFRKSVDNEVPACVTWDRAIRRPLLPLTEVPLDEYNAVDPAESIPEGESLVEIWADAASEKDVFVKAFERHVGSYNFQAAQVILDELERLGLMSEDELEEKRAFLDDREQQVSYTFSRRISEVRSEIEKATLAHILPDEVRSELDADLLELEDRHGKEESLNLKQGLNKLREIQDAIEQERAARKESLGDLIESLRDRAESLGSGLSASSKDKVVSYLAKAEQHLKEDEIALADELITYAESLLEGADYPLDIEDERAPEYVEEYVEFIEAMEEANQRSKDPKWALKRLVAGKGIPNINLGQLSTPRLREVKAGIEAFVELKQSSKKARVALTGHVQAILRYMGFQDVKVQFENAPGSAGIYKARMSAGNLSPLPHYGSQRHGVYHVIVVWERPSADTISQLLHDHRLLNENPIILFAGRLTPRHRQDWEAYAHKSQLSALLIDEYLLEFIAGMRESRLPASIICGIAWSYDNPYTPFGSGSVPPEMFKGRKRMMDQVEGLDAGGTSILYGGRQFGKSTILRIVERNFHDPDNLKYVMYADIKSLGDPSTAQPISDLWRKIRSWFVKQKLLNARVSEDPDVLVREIIDLFEKKPELRTLMLLDEADNFLAADDRDNFKELQRLKNIMDATHRHFKVVLVGLHSVQRYAARPNHPFAHLGNPVIVGPLEPRAARALIEEPLHALGFKFDGVDPILRILAYTNYHPALIQHFCSELIPQVRKNSKNGPPYIVNMEHVEKVYGDPEVRRVMRERFEWTVALDAKYEAIVYAMVVEQLRDRDGYRRTFTPQELYKEATFWWPKGFEGDTLDDVRSLLEELVGLGILIKAETGAYRLRNGNVVRALGSEDEIMNRLQIVSEKAPAQILDRDSLRVPLDFETGQRSPFTMSQAGNINRFRSGIVLVFGSRALGLDDIPLALNQMMQPTSGAATDMPTSCEPLPPEAVSTRAILTQIDRLAEAHDWGRHIIHTTVSQLASSGDLAGVLREVHKKLTKRHGRNRSIRFVVTAGPEDLAHWHSLPGSTQAAMEAEADTIVALKRWSRPMVEQLLKSHAVFAFDRESTHRRVLDTTGGWPILIHELYSMLTQRHEDLANIDITETVEELHQRLQEDPEFIRRFVDATGIRWTPYGVDLLRFIHELGSLQPEEVDAEFIREMQGIPLTEEALEATLTMLQRLAVVELKEGLLHGDPVLLKAVSRL